MDGLHFVVQLDHHLAGFCLPVKASGRRSFYCSEYRPPDKQIFEMLDCSLVSFLPGREMRDWTVADL